MSDVGPQGPHTERNNIHCTPTHTSFKYLLQGLFHFNRIGPIVCWSGIFFGFAAYECSVLNTGYVSWVTAAFGPFWGFMEGYLSWFSGVR